MSEHYLVTLGRDRLQIFTQTPGRSVFWPQWQIVKSIDHPDARDAGPAAGSRSARGPGARRDDARRAMAVAAAELSRFLRQRARASWDLAAPSSLFEPVIEQLSPDIRRRLKRVISEEAAHREIVAAAPAGAPA